MKMEVYTTLTGERIATAPGVAFVEAQPFHRNNIRGPEWTVHMIVGNERYLIGQEHYPQVVDGITFEAAVLRYENALSFIVLTTDPTIGAV